MPSIVRGSPGNHVVDIYRILEHLPNTGERGQRHALFHQSLQLIVPGGDGHVAADILKASDDFHLPALVHQEFGDGRRLGSALGIDNQDALADLGVA